MAKGMAIFLTIMLSNLLVFSVSASNDIDDYEDLEDFGAEIETESVMQDAEAASDISEEMKQRRSRDEREARKSKALLLRQQEQYKVKSKAAEKQIALDEAAIAKAQMQIAKNKAALAKIASDLKQLNGNQQAKHDQLTKLQQRYAEAQKELVARNQELKKVTEVDAQADKAVKVTQQKINAAKKQLAKLYSSLKKARSNTYAKHKRNSQMIEKYRQQIANAQNNLDQLEVRLNAQIDEVSR